MGNATLNLRSVLLKVRRYAGKLRICYRAPHSNGFNSMFGGSHFRAEENNQVNGSRPFEAHNEQLSALWKRFNVHLGLCLRTLSVE